ncbi:hypothetical protein SERLA73DRAFT_183963 [Serpula lacrymans var. lacrymans S7.3]|uniref:Swiss Army Knife protein DSP-PTPase phosphatase domain-containing protein n=2 Tax=Serpula lacrymans var. lacrymans TaxID=341189 RepID=F8Q278_SERL3|nr:uncharacterized protein SERLADRAFT_471385 [Serpula lacrymans var. lacrymans S7.9]EGN97289.1 hypothetical protein SERLA73DRAFT_183963 [Serpula lacrymans var. lacrymans S7.3]EGO22878.1 hypothetical protein SERLADRAFT_471385 [Serpula lacrymans var. lacrymans S7.9]
MSTGWLQWDQETKFVSPGHKLYRSSAPSYAGSDSTQKLTETAVQYLQTQGIDSVISFNQVPYNATEMQLLKDAKISYLHLPVMDYTAATIQQLRSAIAFYKDPKHKATLVHCGFGWGRTGTGVTAIQLDATQGANPPESEWKSVNHVEESVQVAVLKQLKSELQKA